MLVITGLGIGYHSFEHVLHPTIPTSLATWAAIISILMKEALYQVTVQVGKRQHSQVLIANAWHHRTDAISSVLALGGIVGAQLGMHILDPIAGVLVWGLIVKLGISTIRTSVKELTDTVEDTSLLSDIQQATQLIDGVVHCDQIRTRIMGPLFFVDMSIQVDPMMSVSAGHQVAERVRLGILEKFSRVGEVLVHVNPEPDQEQGQEKLMRSQMQIQNDVESVLKAIPTIEGTSHILCHYLNGKLHVEVTISVDQNFTVKDVKEIAKQATMKIEKIQGVDHCDIHLELLASHEMHDELHKTKNDKIKRMNIL